MTQSTDSEYSTTVPIQFVNIAGYRFVALDRLVERRLELLELCKELRLKGSILLSNEGINFFLAGTRSSIEKFLDGIRSQKEFSDLEVKESLSDHQPFNRMLVRIKKEIISMGVPEIKPSEMPSPKIKPETFKQWLDEGRDITILDTRNDYEVEIGTFKNATPIGVDHFRKFPDAVEKLPEELKKKPIVMFCTGGIRCEKAGPLMEQAGFEEVYQLDGGILKYFEDCGDAHYDGECFVFDKRVALAPNLQETETTQCYSCQAVLTAEDQSSDLYQPPDSCPKCFKTPDQKLKILTAARNLQIRNEFDVLPGSVPYNNIRPINVPLNCDQKPAIEFLLGVHRGLGRDFWIQEIRVGRVVYKGQPLEAERTVRSGWRVEHHVPHTIEPDVNANIKILYEDEALIGVHKPAPLPMHPSGRFNRNTLVSMLGKIYDGLRLRIVHRLDANTSGVVLICLKRQAADALRVQFEQGTIKKTYLAQICGHPVDDQFVLNRCISNAPEAAGLRVTSESGLQAETRVKVLERFANGNSLVECEPITGRTNQIRVHLWDCGHPVIGDISYLPGKQLGHKQTIDRDANPMCLHAHSIEFRHPVSNQEMKLVANPPGWLQATHETNLPEEPTNSNR